MLVHHGLTDRENVWCDTYQILYHVILDIQKIHYDAWRELFETHYLSFGISDHLDGSYVPANLEDTPWKERGSLIKMWMYGTISSSLLDTVLKTRCMARELWITIEKNCVDSYNQFFFS